MSTGVVSKLKRSLTTKPSSSRRDRSARTLEISAPRTPSPSSPPLPTTPPPPYLEKIIAIDAHGNSATLDADGNDVSATTPSLLSKPTKPTATTGGVSTAGSIAAAAAIVKAAALGLAQKEEPRSRNGSVTSERESTDTERNVGIESNGGEVVSRPSTDTSDDDEQAPSVVDVTVIHQLSAFTLAPFTVSVSPPATTPTTGSDRSPPPTYTKVSASLTPPLTPTPSRGDSTPRRAASPASSSSKTNLADDTVGSTSKPSAPTPPARSASLAPSPASTPIAAPTPLPISTSTSTSTLTPTAAPTPAPSTRRKPSVPRVTWNSDPVAPVIWHTEFATNLAKFSDNLDAQLKSGTMRADEHASLRADLERKVGAVGNVEVSELAALRLFRGYVNGLYADLGRVRGDAVPRATMA